MKKIILLLLLIVITLSGKLSAQCPISGANFGSIAAPTLSCTSVNSTTCAFFDEFSTFTGLVAGNTYLFTVTAAPTLAGPYTFGVYNNSTAGSLPVAFTTSATYPMTITYTPTVSGSYFVKTNFGGVACSSAASNCQSYFLECLSCPAPVTGITTTQPSTAVVPAGTLNAQILRANLTGLCGSTLTSASFATTGSTAPLTDILSAKVYYTSTTTFATTTQFGSTVANPNGPFTVSGSLPLTNGLGYLWLVYDLSCGATVTNLIDAEVTSVTLASGVLTPVTPNPTGTRAITAPASVATNQPLTTAVTAGSVNNIVLRVDMLGNNCSGSLTQLDLTNVSTNVADITSAKVFYTTTTTFSAATQFGSAVINPGATFSVTGSQLLATTGTNYFWLVFDVSCAATVANLIDAGLVGAVTSGTGTLTPTTANPTGTRAIAASGTTFSTVAAGDWSAPATWACGIVPSNVTTDVFINHNVSVTTSVSSGSVTVASGSTLTVSAGSLTLGTSSAGAGVGNSNRLMTVTGTLTLSGGTLNMNGGMTFPLNSTFNMSGGTLNLDPNDGTATSYTANSAMLFLTSNINVTGGNINILDPSFSTTTGASQRSISYSFTTTSATFGTGCIVTLGGGDDTNILNTTGFYLESTTSSGTLTFGTVIHNGGNFANKRHASTFNSASFITSIRNLTVNAGCEYQIPSVGAILAISGNLVNNGVIINPNTANPTASCLAFVGGAVFSGGVAIIANTAAQSITGTGFFKKTTTELDPTAQTGNNTGNLLVFHTAGSPGLTLGMPLTVSSGIRFLEGRVNTTPTNFLALGHGTSIPGNPNALTAGNGSIIGASLTAYTTSSAYDGGWVVGPFKRWFTAVANVGQTGLLPVGFDTTTVAQVLFTAAPATPGYLTASWIEGNAVTTFAPALIEPAVTPSVIDHNTTGMWDIGTDGALTGGTYTASLTDSENATVTDYLNTTMIKRPTSVSPWALEGVHVATTGSNANPTLSRTGMSTFGQYAIGSGFGPLVACTDEPTMVNITAISSSSATANWTAPAPPPGNGYDYYFSSVSTPPTISTIPSGNTASTSVILSLSPNTTYYFWVRSNCGGQDVSDWTATTTFMTSPGTGCFSMITSNITPICAGSNIILSASGTWVSAQWYGPSGIIGGATTTNLSLSNVQTSINGTYSIQLVDATACTYTATYVLTVNPLPVATAGATPNPICTGATLNLSSSGGSTYAWSGPAGFTSALQNPTRAGMLSTYAGVYTVTVTSAAGCTATATVNVTVNTTPVATAGATPNPICAGSTLNLSSSGGSTYAWSGPAGFTSTSQNPTRPGVLVSHAGTYTVTVTSAAGCSATASVVVAVNPAPVATASALPNPICVGNNLNLSSSGGTTYAWSGPASYTSTQQNPTRFNMQTTYAGVYTVSVTSGLGCTATASVNVVVNPLPSGVATATPSNACVGSTVQLGAPAGTTFMWTGPQGYTSSLQNPVLNITSYKQAGVYRVKVTNAAGCSATFSVTISITFPPVATASYQVGTNCTGSNLVLNGTGAGGYSWSGPNGFTSNQQNPVINNVSAANSGVYTLVVTSPTGCSATVSITVPILAPPVATASADDYDVCEGETVYLHASGGVSYQWSGPYGWVSNYQHPVITSIPSYMTGIYTVTVTNSGGCTSTAIVKISVSNFINGTASATPNPASAGSNVQLLASGGVSYLWSGPNGFFSTEQNPLINKFSSRNAGTYVVIITNEGGCQMTLFVSITIITGREGQVINAESSSVPELGNVYPNPAKNFVKVDYTGEKSIKYNIVDARGIIVIKDATSADGNINIESLSSGTYAIIWSEDALNANQNIGKFIKVD